MIKMTKDIFISDKHDCSDDDIDDNANDARFIVLEPISTSHGKISTLRKMQNEHFKKDQNKL